jgi:hypothetical protein
MRRGERKREGRRRFKTQVYACQIERKKDNWTLMMTGGSEYKRHELKPEEAGEKIYKEELKKLTKKDEK